jgi:hypothetical protein
MTWQKQALIALRNALQWLESNPEAEPILQQAYHQNRWFEIQEVKKALKQWIVSLSDDAIDAWLAQYTWPTQQHNKHLGVIMAGNVPLVGLHDLIVGVLSGYKVSAKLSSDDAVLPKQLLQNASTYDAIWSHQVEFVEQLKQLEIAIATGSNNSARYFSAYFKNIPHVIRNHRNSMAILSGQETTEDFIALGKDVFDFYGLGCRNVTHLLLPANYDFTPLFQCWDAHYADIQHHNKYINNYQYHRAMLLMNLDPHIDTGYVIAKEKLELYAPVGMLNYSFYNDITDVQQRMAEWQNQLQCVVSNMEGVDALALGQAQCTTLGDYADGVDTVKWLLDQAAHP